MGVILEDAAAAAAAAAVDEYITGIRR